VECRGWGGRLTAYGSHVRAKGLKLRSEGAGSRAIGFLVDELQALDPLFPQLVP